MEQRTYSGRAAPVAAPVIDLKKQLFKKGYASPLSLKEVLRKSVKPILWGSLFTATLMGLLAWKQGKAKEAVYKENVKQQDFDTALEQLKEEQG